MNQMNQTVWHAPTSFHAIAVVPGETLTISIKRGNQPLLELTCLVEGRWPAGLITAISMSVEKPWENVERAP